MNGLNRRHRDEGFTMVELLVVMAISVILLGLIFGPILSSFNFVARGEQTTEAQETSRRALQEVSREVKDSIQLAVAAGDALKLPQADNANIRNGIVRSMGYINAWDDAGVAHPLTGALLDFIPADDTLGLHGGSTTTPLVPQTTAPNHAHEAAGGRTQAATGKHNIVIRYFIGLMDPGYPHQTPGDRFSPRTAARPVWINTDINPDVLGGADVDNTYILYRVEFDTEDPAFGNWLVPEAGAKTPTFLINPDFFYDNAKAPNGETYWANWRRNAVALTPVTNIDLVRFTRANGNKGAVTAAQSTVTFTPSVVEGDTANPTTNQDGAPVSYVATHGNWTGVQNAGNLTATGFNPPAVGFYPHITVYAQNATCRDPLLKVYDNWVTKASNSSDPCSPDAYPDRSRVLTWDSRSGTVRFRAGAKSGSGDAQEVDLNDILLTPNDNRWQFDLVDLAVKNNKLVVPASLRQYLRIIPGSETVTISFDYPSVNVQGQEDFSTPVRRSLTFQRNTSFSSIDTPSEPTWWNASLWGNYPATLPRPGAFVVNPKNGKIQIGFPWRGPDNPEKSQPIPPYFGDAGQLPTNARISFHYAFQTNRPDDIVKVDYSTKSLLNVAMGIRVFDPSTSRPILSQLSGKVALRNLGR